ncbi:MAG: hypothetical protein QGI09_10860, partial [Dehalococcoidia bacterium]|nr:hypothetical protein [Dehalococcoidia bacterium]
MQPAVLSRGPHPRFFVAPTRRDSSESSMPVVSDTLMDEKKQPFCLPERSEGPEVAGFFCSSPDKPGSKAPPQIPRPRCRIGARNTC